MAVVKEALEKAGLKRHLIIQPIGYKTPECAEHTNPSCRLGMTALPEFPFGMCLSNIPLQVGTSLEKFISTQFGSLLFS